MRRADTAPDHHSFWHDPALPFIEARAVQDGRRVCYDKHSHPHFSIGAITGGLIMGVLNNGMSLMGVGIDYQQFIKGLVLLLAVGFDVFNKRRASNALK